MDISLPSNSRLPENPAACYRACRDAAGQIVDFEQIGGSGAALASRLFAEADASFLIRQWALVVETGRTVGFAMPPLRGGAEAQQPEVQASRHLDGVRVCSRENTPPGHPTDLLLDSILCGVVVGEAVRDDAGRIVDIRIVKVNKRASDMALHTPAQMVGQLKTVLFPGVRETGVLDFYIRTIESNSPQVLELKYAYDGLDVWANLQTHPYGDGLIITWTDVTERRNAQAELLKQADLLHEIMENASPMIDLLEPVRNADGEIEDFIYRMVNQTGLAAMGLSEKEVVGRRLRTLFPGVVRSGVLARLIAVAQTGQTSREIVHYEGEGRQAWTDSKYVRHDGCVITFSFDLTAVFLAETKLQQQAQLLTTIINNTQEGITLLDPIRAEDGSIVDFRYIFTNAANSRNTSRSIEEMTGGTLTQLFPFMVGSEWHRHLLHTAATGESRSFLIEVRQQGISGWFDTLFIKIGDQVLFTDRNVTGLKEAELAQQRNADLLERVMNTAPTAIVVHESIRDAAGCIVDFRMMQANQPAAAMMRAPLHHIENQLISRFFPDVEHTPAFEAYRQVAETGRPARFENNLSGRWYDFSVAPFGDGIVVAVQDITDTYRHRMALEAANRELQRSNENLRSFTFLTSHDLQEPARKLVLFADLLQRQHAPQLDGTATETLRRIGASARRLRTLIQDVLAYTQIENAATTRQPVDLARLVRELEAGELQADIRQSHARIHLGDLPALAADPAQIRLLFQHLLSNALKFQAKGAEPEVHLKARRLGRSELPAHLAAVPEAGPPLPRTLDFMEITVADNGIGFEAQYAEHIFQVFRRLHRQDEYPGSGMGLALCRKIAGRHGGWLLADSRPGAGSVFTVLLPCTPP